MRRGVNIMSKGPNLPFYGFRATAKHVGNSTERQRQRVVMRVAIKSYREKCKTKECQGRLEKEKWRSTLRASVRRRPGPYTPTSFLITRKIRRERKKKGSTGVAE